TKPLDEPPYRLVSRTKGGTVQYTYADPENCRCVYLGGAKEYTEYRRLATERRLDDERRRAAGDVGGRDSWGLQLRGDCGDDSELGKRNGPGPLPNAAGPR